MVTNLARVEGLVYAAGDNGITVAQLGTVLKLSRRQVSSLLKRLEKLDLRNVNTALEIFNSAGRIRVVTKPELRSDLRVFFRSHSVPVLTPAALETLTIIAYRQPITRVEVDAIRGVNSSVIIRKLLERQLIRKHGHKATLGDPVTYITTEEFLNLFGLKTLKQLPTIKMVHHDTKGMNKE